MSGAPEEPQATRPIQCDDRAVLGRRGEASTVRAEGEAGDRARGPRRIWDVVGVTEPLQVVPFPAAQAWRAVIQELFGQVGLMGGEVLVSEGDAVVVEGLLGGVAGGGRLPGLLHGVPAGR